MRRVLFVVLKVIGVVLDLPPLLLLGTCTYTAYSPHLRFDPLIVDLMDTPRHPERGWRTIDVTLTPRYLQLGQSRAEVLERLEASGFALFADYSTDVGPHDIHPGDDMPQAGLDQMHREAREHFNALGVTHIFGRSGRTNFACGETLFVEIGVSGGGLTQATGYSRYTCL